MTRRPEILRTPLHNHLTLQRAVALTSQHQCAMRDSKEAGDVVSHNYGGRSDSSGEAYEHFVNLSRTYRIKPGSRFVCENEIGVERQRARKSHTFFHSATDSGRTLRSVFFQTDHSQLEPGGFKQDIWI
jgi:hypothetical protein